MGLKANLIGIKEMELYKHFAPLRLVPFACFQIMILRVTLTLTCLSLRVRQVQSWHSPVYVVKQSRFNFAGYKFDENDRESANLRLQFARFPGPRSAGGPRGRR